MQDIGVDEKPNAQLPLDAAFTDEMGRQLTLKDCLISGKPAILQLGYFGCPMLCEMASRAARSRSTRTTRAAPRESDSIARAPDPE